MSTNASAAQPEAIPVEEQESSVSDPAKERRDVIIAGAGLVGLALAAALGRVGLSVTLLDRAQAMPPIDPDTWDARVYAVSPGSAAFLQRVGAWQALSCERIQAIESMRIMGDRGAVLGFSAYELGERALAWIVEERALRAALLPVGSSRVDLQACKLEYSIVSPK